MMKRSLRTSPHPAPRTASPGGLVATGTGLVAVTYGMIRFGYGLHLPVLRTELGLSAALAGAIAAGSFAAYCVSALVAQRVLLSRSARPVLWGAAAAASAGSALVALAWSPGALATGVLVSGSAAGAASPALVSAVAATVPARWQGRAQGAVNAGTGLGVLAGALFVLAVPQAWRAAWAVAAVLALVTAVGVVRATDWPATARPVPARAARTAARTASRPAPAGAPQASLLSLALALRRPVAAATLAGTGSAAVWTFGRDLLSDVGALSPRTTALLWCLLGAAAVLGATSGDAVVRFGLRPAWAAAALATAAGTALLALAPSLVVVAGAAGALFGGAYTALTGVLIAWAGALRPDAGARGTAVLFVALTAGQALGAAATGAVVPRAGGTATFLASAAFLALAAAVLPRREAPPS